MALLTPHDPCFLARGGNLPPLDWQTAAGKPYWPLLDWQSVGRPAKCVRKSQRKENARWQLIGLLKDF